MPFDNDDLDPDVVAIRKRNAVSQIPVGKSPMSGKNPQLQPEDEYDYEKDVDVSALKKRKAKPAEEKDVGGFLPSWLKGGGEASLHTIASALSYPASAVAGIYGTLTSGKFGTQAGVQAGEELAQKVQRSMQNAGTQPTTEEGKAILESLGQGFEALHAPPVFPEAEGLRISREPAMVGGQNAKQQLQAQFGNLVPKVRIEKTPSGLQSAGAAATTNPAIIKGNIDAAIANASPELQNHIKSQAPENINLNALETRALEEKHGINLLKSQRTGNTQEYSEAWNSRGKNGLQEDFSQQPKQLAKAFEESKIRNAPDISSEADASELGQHIINGLAETDKRRVQNIDSAYRKFRDAYLESKQKAGLPIESDFPVNGKQFLENANKALIKEGAQFDVPEPIQKLLDLIKNNDGKLNYQEFLNLDKRLGVAQREGVGSQRAAAKILRNELNNIELGEEAADLQPLYSQAKALAKERFDTIESSPAYAAAIDAAEDAKLSRDGVSLAADKFHKNFISNSSPEAIRRLKGELPQDHVAHQAIAFGELERAKRAITNANESRIKSDQFAEFLKNNKSKLRESLSPEAMQDVMEIGLLNSKIGKPEAGTFNYSNSYSALLSDLAKQGLLTLGEAKLAGATGGVSIPLVGAGKSLVQKYSKEAYANEQRNPLAGLTKENK